MNRIRVLSVASEVFPLAKTGGLADVAGALPPALREHGVDMTTLMPGYPSVLAALRGLREIHTEGDFFGGPARFLAGNAAGLDLIVIDAPHLYGRPGNPYLGPDGQDWPDNALRFGALSWAASRFALGDIPFYAPDILHCHDWQAGLAPAYLAYDGRKRTPTLLTVHNLAYQGRFPRETIDALRLPPRAYDINGVEYYGGIGFLKAGLKFADRITTVSPTYAREMQMPGNGFGLDGLIAARSPDISGIVNGIDTAIWDPARDPRIASRFGPGSLAARAPNKAALQRRFGLEENPRRLLFGVVSRLVWQKGLDLLAAAIPALLRTGAQLAVLGNGETELEQRFSLIAAAAPSRLGCKLSYDEDLAHLMQAGADSILVPSRFEPCGLTQLCAQRYGALPLVAKVGGLADTVADPDEAGAAATGLHFLPVTRESLETALSRAGTLWTDQNRWQAMQRNAMNADVSWRGPGARYAALYRDVLARKI
jgi:starch synthase